MEVGFCGSSTTRPPQRHEISAKRVLYYQQRGGGCSVRCQEVWAVACPYFRLGCPPWGRHPDSVLLFEVSHVRIAAPVRRGNLLPSCEVVLPRIRRKRCRERVQHQHRVEPIDEGTAQEQETRHSEYSYYYSACGDE